MMGEVTTRVSYFNDYPMQNGTAHVFFADGLIDGILRYRNEIISMHPSEGCFLDHESRINEIEVPQEITLRFKRYAWAEYKAVNG
jgi:hypothetical protein